MRFRMDMQPQETFYDLVKPFVERREFVSFCRAAGLTPTTVYRLIYGESTPHRGTVVSLARKLRLPEVRVAAAIRETRRLAANPPY